MEKNFDVRISYDEIKGIFLRQLDGIGKTKSTAKAFLQTASLIVALLSGLQILTMKVKPELVALYYFGLIITFLLYAYLIFLCVGVLKPLITYSPMAAEWDVFQDTMFEKSERDIYKQLISSYANVIQLNGVMIVKINKKTARAGWILGTIVILLLFISLLPK